MGFKLGFFLLGWAILITIFLTSAVNLSPKVEASTIFRPRVLALVVNPTQGSDNLFDHYFGWQLGGQTFNQAVDTNINETIEAFDNFTEGQVKYQLAGKVTLNTFPPNTNNFQYTFDNYSHCVDNTTLPNGNTCEQQKWLVDHNSWLTSLNFCQTMQTYGADEVWVYSAPYVLTWESFMFGSDSGFWVNGPSFVIPGCNKHYIVTAGGTTEPNLHVYGHRVEATLNYLTQVWNETDRQTYWENFSNVSRYATNPNPFTGVGCGNAHFPKNGTNHYDYYNQTSMDFNCPDWQNFPNLTGETENLDCYDWGCTDPGWGAHWLGSLPNGAGETMITRNDTREIPVWKNWWGYILNPDATIGYVAGTPVYEPQILGLPDCLEGPVTNQNLITISWINPLSKPANYVNISTSSNFTNYYNKGISTTPTPITQTQAPIGFGMPGSGWLTIKPDTTYYVRLYNSDTHSSTVSFNIHKCN